MNIPIQIIFNSIHIDTSVTSIRDFIKKVIKIVKDQMSCLLWERFDKYRKRNAP